MKPSTILLPLATLALAAPKDSCKPSCNTLSSSASVTITDFAYRGSYIFSTPAHQNSHGYVDFNLTSSVTGATTSCSASSSQLTDFFYGNMNYTCADGSTLFTFNKPTGELGVVASWNCTSSGGSHGRGGGHGGRKTKTWTGAGLEALDLECEETSWQNPNWTMGQIYSDREVNCNASQTVIELETTSS